ncbi:CCR4-NOT transcription complex, subunit 6-like protein [Reticulomyxa filosa]|uniref:CCR4-NOT transcription complex, subunit 6-like protein n=1 Tax=Reticulomyxa filosa TaxID=46433 RepID=X6NQQ3_RETFI|nr:CCR4-NOT transcription complex, subunit 6-like protein [Reticulomyxa filosa]|eukprot:ETO28248.1 CCR4-NOT transcription complex, subunit 6-like protein [Reticulomyxa filosa]
MNQSPEYVPRYSLIDQLLCLKKQYASLYCDLLPRSLEKCNGESKSKSASALQDDIDEKQSIDNETCTYRLMQFNILADGLSGYYTPESPVYYHINMGSVDRELLNYGYRGFRTLEEIVRWDPDVVTIQEMDQLEFYRYYLKDTYTIVHAVKPNSPIVRVGLRIQKYLPLDGCAILFKHKRFQMLQCWKFNGASDLSAPKACANLIVIVVHFQCKQTASFYFNDKCGETDRLYQLGYVCNKLKGIMEALQTPRSGKTEPRFVPLFIGCDLNTMCVPYSDFVPYVYWSLVHPEKLFSKSHRRITNDANVRWDAKQQKIGKEGKEKGEEEEERGEKGNSSSLQLDQNILQLMSQTLQYENGYGLNLKSVYEEHSKEKRNPSYTSTVGGLRCLDYIFYQPDRRVQATELLSVPTEAKVTLPSWSYPSDHFSLLATFKLS